jgi:hypothetical protein
VKIHTVFITYNRLELTKQAIESYLETVSVPFTYYVTDNASSDGTHGWLYAKDHPHCSFGTNHYPGLAANFGWERAPEDAGLLHRADNDFKFLPGWSDEVERMFSENPKLGQLGLRTDREENWEPGNTGGNCVIRRELWDAGLRYDETPWPEIRARYGDGYSEDSFFSGQVEAMGYEWTRVKRPCIQNLASGDWGDSYYQESYGIRGIRPRPDDPTLTDELREKLL